MRTGERLKKCQPSVAEALRKTVKAATADGLRRDTDKPYLLHRDCQKTETADSLVKGIQDTLERMKLYRAEKKGLPTSKINAKGAHYNIIILLQDGTVKRGNYIGTGLPQLGFNIGKEATEDNKVAHVLVRKAAEPWMSV